MNIWRINCKPGSQLVEHKESFKKWIEKEFVGIGWSKEENFLLGLENINISAHAIKEHIYESLKKSNYRTRSYITYTNILFNRMKKGDYIWTRCDGIYKLGIIIDENCLYNTYPNEDFIPNRYQIGFYRKVKWLKKDFVENEVPGKIIASFRNPSTLQKVYENKNELSLYCKINIENNSIHFPIADWKNLLSAEDIEKGTLDIDLNSLEGKIEFKDVNFSYNKDTPVLKDLSFKAEHGEIVAIVGPTGGGKTTIVNLLMRFYDITSGKILLDDKDIELYKKKDIRKLFGMVLQDSWLFTGTIRENISYGNSEIDFDKVVESAKLACAHDFIIKLPQGYDTVVSEDNMVLSQGQKQLITIARIIALDPKFLILDEATSGVDTRTEIRLQKAISNLVKGRTSFIIAHRLSTIKNANLILVLKDGHIIEQGTHSQLMEKNGFYHELYNTQYML